MKISIEFTAESKVYFARGGGDAYGVNCTMEPMAISTIFDVYCFDKDRQAKMDKVIADLNRTGRAFFLKGIVFPAIKGA